MKDDNSTSSSVEKKVTCSSRLPCVGLRVVDFVRGQRWKSCTWDERHHSLRKLRIYLSARDLFGSTCLGSPVNVALDEVPLVLFHVLTHLLPGDEVWSMGNFLGQILKDNGHWSLVRLTLSECWSRIPGRPTSLPHTHGSTAHGPQVSEKVHDEEEEEEEEVIESTLEQ